MSECFFILYDLVAGREGEDQRIRRQSLSKADWVRFKSFIFWISAINLNENKRNGFKLGMKRDVK